jgi:glutamine amidotransferase
MCRLYGFRATELTKVECTLAYAQNNLLHQSRGDLRGETHPDGWGIAHYEDGVPSVERRATAAYETLDFSRVAERTYARTVVAHVRRATVGRGSLVNTHPFVVGRWSFAHNGTVRGFDVVGPRMAREVPPDLLARRRGITDSELAFLWLLGRLRDGGASLDDALSAEYVAEVLARGVCVLEGYCRDAGADRPAQLNFVLTDGHVLCASRWRHSLYLLMRHGVQDCEICGIPHVRHHEGADYRAAVIASEPITHEAWEAVHEGTVVALDDDVQAETYPI